MVHLPYQKLIKITVWNVNTYWKTLSKYLHVFTDIFPWIFSKISNFVLNLLYFKKMNTLGFTYNKAIETTENGVYTIYIKGENSYTLGENCALATDQSVDWHATILFTVSINSAKVWNRGFNWPVFGVGMHKKSPNDECEKNNDRRYSMQYAVSSASKSWRWRSRPRRSSPGGSQSSATTQECRSQHHTFDLKCNKMLQVYVLIKPANKLL